MCSGLWSLFVFLLALVEPSGAKPTLVPNLDLGSLCSHADVIVVGVVGDVRGDGDTTVNVQGQSLEAPSVSAELNVRRVLKGKLAGSKLSFKFALRPPPAGVIVRGQFGIFFFRERESGIEILDPYHPHVVALPGAARVVGGCLEQVTAELGHVVGSPAAPVPARREAVEALATLRTPAATAALQAATRDRDAGPRVLAIAALLARGDMSWLGPAASLLLSHEQGMDPYLIWRLATVIEGRVRDPNAISTLVRLLHAPDVTVRRAAVAALRNTGDTAAVGALVEALSDTDDGVLYQAVFGLAEITGNLDWGPPPLEEFKEERDRYVSHWQNWAKSRKRVLRRRPAPKPARRVIETESPDIRKLRDAQEPDFQGNRIPAGATDGSVLWTRLDDMPVMGRLVVLKRRQGMVINCIDAVPPPLTETGS